MGSRGAGKSNHFASAFSGHHGNAPGSAGRDRRRQPRLARTSTSAFAAVILKTAICSPVPTSGKTYMRHHAGRSNRAASGDRHPTGESGFWRFNPLRPPGEQPVTTRGAEPHHQRWRFLPRYLLRFSAAEPQPLPRGQSAVRCDRLTRRTPPCCYSGLYWRRAAGAIENLVTKGDGKGHQGGAGPPGRGHPLTSSTRTFQYRKTDWQQHRNYQGYPRHSARPAAGPNMPTLTDPAVC